MLEQLFPNFKGNRVISKMAELYHSPWYLGLVAVLIAWSEIFGHEAAVYPILIALMGVGLLVSEDSRPALPIVLFGYVSVGHDHNPIKAPESLFYQKWFQIELFIVLGIGVALLLLRAVLSILKGARLHPKMLGGMLFLSLAYLLGGLGNFSSKSFLFGFVQCVSLLFFYLFFLLTMDWEKVERDYLPFAFLVLGLIVALQIADMYTHEGVFTEEGVNRNFLFTGWGVYNNVACIMAMCIPAPCYFAATKKDGWKFTVLMVIFFFCTLLTQSRGGMLFGSIVYLVSILYVLLSVRGRARQGHLAVLIALLLLFFVCGVLLREKIDALFASIIKVGMSSSGRVRIYKACWETFLQNPWFGVGFYDTPGVSFDEFLHFMSPRAHNTILQLLATGGLTCFLTYCYHRIQTMILLFRKRSHEKAFVTLSILALLLTSLLDCNFFNFGPAIIYGILLASAEGFENVPRRKTLLTPLGGGEPDFGIARAGYFSR